MAKYEESRIPEKSCDRTINKYEDLASYQHVVLLTIVFCAAAMVTFSACILNQNLSLIYLLLSLNKQNFGFWKS